MEPKYRVALGVIKPFNCEGTCGRAICSGHCHFSPLESLKLNYEVRVCWESSLLRDKSYLDRGMQYLACVAAILQ